MVACTTIVLIRRLFHFIIISPRPHFAIGRQYNHMPINHRFSHVMLLHSQFYLFFKITLISVRSRSNGVLYEDGSESSVIGVITLLINMIGCCIIYID